MNVKIEDNSVQPGLQNINIDDNHLVELCRRGDTSAVERLIIKYQDRIYNVILKICGNRDDAAELTQDTFVKVIEHIHGFEEKSSFYTWVFKIAVNLTLNHCNRRVKLGFKSLDMESETEESKSAAQLKMFLANDGSSDPAAIAEMKELCNLVTASIMRLEDDQRAVLVMRDIENMSYNQIAEILELELGTVKSRLNRARNNLRDILKAILK